MKSFTTIAGVTGHTTWSPVGGRIRCQCGAWLADRGHLAAHVRLAALGVAARRAA